MKKLTLSFLASLAVAATSFAGHQVIEKQPKNPVAPEPCFRDQEFQFDVYGTYYGGANNRFGDGWGGGVGANWFFTHNFGLALTGDIYDGHHGRENPRDTAIWNTDLDIVARLPIEGALCWAPYLVAGGGIQADGTTVGTWNVGLGLEFRFTHNVSFFTEGRAQWAAGDQNGIGNGRAGLRFVF
jgi:hypothetical protein